MAAVAVREEVKNAFFFHEAGDEVEVGLTVLNHIGPLAVVAHELVFDREAVFAQHFLDDVRCFFELEDFEVGAACGMPQPGSEHRLICTEIAVATNVGELRHLPGDEPLAAACVLSGQINLDAHVLA